MATAAQRARSVDGSSHPAPRRVALHGLFTPAKEAPPPTLKPGQAQLQRQDFYVTSALACPQRELYFQAPMTSKSSMYTATVAGVPVASDYTAAARARKERSAATAAAVLSSSAGSAGTSGGAPLGHWSSSHWRSTASASWSEANTKGSTYARQYRAAAEAATQPSCLTGTPLETTAQAEMGEWGSNPYDRVDWRSNKLPVNTSVLTQGTTKGTAHIPGYQGFLPKAATAAAAAAERQLAGGRGEDRSLIALTYLHNLPGYGGFLPAEASNDCGPRQMTSMTVYGQDYGSAAW